jgi:hypothetical protein
MSPIEALLGMRFGTPRCDSVRSGRKKSACWPNASYVCVTVLSRAGIGREAPGGDSRCARANCQVQFGPPMRRPSGDPEPGWPAAAVGTGRDLGPITWETNEPRGSTGPVPPQKLGWSGRPFWAAACFYGLSRPFSALGPGVPKARPGAGRHLLREGSGASHPQVHRYLGLSRAAGEGAGQPRAPCNRLLSPAGKNLQRAVL